ncbi:MAG: hydantoinase/oxoprolinase family protein [Burkholderiaceae bacterium]
MAMRPQSELVVGIEVGGTFTDLLLVDGSRTLTHKVPSTPADPAIAALTGLDQLLAMAERRAADIGTLLHGSTIAANALIQRRGARTGLIATRGFRDLLFTQRADKSVIYDLFYQKPAPLIERECCIEAVERMSADGAVIEPLDLQSAEAALADLVIKQRVESIAVCLLHSYANPAHERQLAELAARLHPQVPVTLSSEVAPEHREYERTSTVAISAYLRPIIDRYLSRFADGMVERGFRGTPLIMLSNGGVVPIQMARRMPASMFLSGPAAAASGAAYVARESGCRDVISIDVGGTSSDVCLINGGEIQTTIKGTAEFSIDGLPLNLMMTDVVSIGAGGGSIAALDPGGMLQVGPQSAGADPGPACYGLGGEAFSLTDAMLLLGILDAGRILPGGIRLDAARARAAAGPLCERLQLSPEQLADRVYRIAVSNMAQAVRRVSVKRGYDPRQYALLPAGGVGALVCCALAEELGIDRIVVPHHPGIFSAFGLCTSDLRMDYVRADGAQRCSEMSGAALKERLDDLKQRACVDFGQIGHDLDALTLSFSADARYIGQGYELRVPVAADAALGDAGGRPLAEGFHELHRRQYGHHFPARDVEVLALRLSAIAPRPHALLNYPSGAPAESATRPVLCGGRSLDHVVLDRSSLREGFRADGPLIVVEQTTSLLVNAGWSAFVDEHAFLRLSRKVTP